MKFSRDRKYGSQKIQQPLESQTNRQIQINNNNSPKLQLKQKYNLDGYHPVNYTQDEREEVNKQTKTNTIKNNRRLLENRQSDFLNFLTNRSKETGFFVIKMIIQKYQKEIKKFVSNNCVYQIEPRLSIIKCIQSLSNQLTIQTFNKQNVEQYKAKNSKEAIQTITQKYANLQQAVNFLQRETNQILRDQQKQMKHIINQDLFNPDDAITSLKIQCLNKYQNYIDFLTKNQQNQRQFYQSQLKAHGPSYHKKDWKYYNNLSLQMKNILAKVFKYTLTLMNQISNSNNKKKKILQQVITSLKQQYQQRLSIQQQTKISLNYEQQSQNFPLQSKTPQMLINEKQLQNNIEASQPISLKYYKLKQTVKDLVQQINYVIEEQRTSIESLLDQILVDYNIYGTLNRDRMYLNLINAKIKLFTNCQDLQKKEISQGIAHYGDQYRKNLYWRDYNKYLPDMTKIIVAVYQSYKDLINKIQRAKLGWKTYYTNQNQQIKEQYKRQKVLRYQFQAQYQKLKVYKTDCQQTIYQLRSQITKLKQKQKSMRQTQKYNELIRQQQVQKRIQTEQSLKSCIDSFSIFIANVNQTIQQQSNLIIDLFSQQNISNLLKRQGQFSCDYSTLIKDEQQQDSISECSILNGLISQDQNIDQYKYYDKKLQAIDFTSQLKKVNQKMFKTFEKIKTKICKQIQQRDEKYKQMIQQKKHNRSFSRLNTTYSKNSLDNNQIQIEMQHLKIQANIAKEEKQTTIKKLAQKQYELILANEKIEEMQMQLEETNDIINSLQEKLTHKQRDFQKLELQSILQKRQMDQQKDKRIQIEQNLQKETQTLNELKKILQNHQQTIEQLRIQIEEFASNKDENQNYFRQKAEQIAKLKRENQQHSLLISLLKEKQIQMYKKLEIQQSQKEILLLTNNKLHRQIQNLKEKRRTIAKANFQYEEQISEIINKKRMEQKNQSLILQKVTKANQTIEEV